MANEDTKLTIYGSLIGQLMLFSTAGIGAGAAVLPSMKIGTVAVFVSWGAFTLSLGLAFFGFSAVLGQADNKSSDIHNPWIRYPVLGAFGSFLIGIILLMVGAYQAFDSGNLSSQSNGAIQVINTCSELGGPPQQQLSCITNGISGKEASYSRLKKAYENLSTEKKLWLEQVIRQLDEKK